MFLNLFSRNGLFLIDSYTKAATCDETPFSRRIEKRIGETYLEASWNLCCHVIPEHSGNISERPLAAMPRSLNGPNKGSMELLSPKEAN